MLVTKAYTSETRWVRLGSTADDAPFVETGQFLELAASLFSK